MQRPRANLARNLHLDGIRRNTHTESRRLITWRSQVQILPTLLRKALETGPFASHERWRRPSLLCRTFAGSERAFLHRGSGRRLRLLRFRTSVAPSDGATFTTFPTGAEPL